MFHHKYIKVYLFFAIVALLIFLNHKFGWSELFLHPENLPTLRQALKKNLFKAMLIYVGLTVIGCVVFALPGVTFALAAGLLFGPFLGTVACSIATTLGACLAFWAGRYFLKDAVKPLVMKNKILRKVLFEKSNQNAFFLLMLTRLVPIFPYNLQNFAYGMTDIAFGSYALYSLLFMLPGTAAYVIAAASVSDRNNRFLYLSIAVILFIVVTIFSLILKKRHDISTASSRENLPVELTFKEEEK